MATEPNLSILVRYLAILRNIVGGNPSESGRPLLSTIYPFNQPDALRAFRAIIERCFESTEAQGPSESDDLVKTLTLQVRSSFIHSFSSFFF